MKTIDFSNVREYYGRMRPEGHWFDVDTMRFFKTKLPDVAYETNAGLLFITRETNPSGKSRFSIRRQKVNGDIDTVGEFHSFSSNRTAFTQLTKLDRGIA